MPVTAPVKLSKIKTEFSGPNKFKSYVRGGAYVASSTANNSISTTVAGMKMSQFLGAAKDVAFSVGVSPPMIVSNLANGETWYQSFTANVTGGVGPFTFSWSWDGMLPAATLTGVTGQTVHASASGQNRGYQGDIVVVVRDAGNGNQQRTAAASILVQIGTPL